MDVVFPWGQDELVVRLPERWRLLGSLTPRAMPTGIDPEDECQAALAEPIKAAPLRARDLSGKRIVVVTDDHSRPTPVHTFVEAILGDLAAAGATPEQIEFLVATGVHRQSTPTEMSQKLGPGVLSRFEWRCHDAHDMARLSRLGQTALGTPVWLNSLLVEADLVVCIGAAEPHLLAGFSGGMKALVPGCAGHETIGINHLQGTGAHQFDFIGMPPGSTPMRQDLEEASGLLGNKVFIVNAVLDDASQPIKFFCGDPIAAHRAAVDYVQQFLRIEVPEQADVVLANSYPMDTDLRQSAKCFGNAMYATKANGVLLGCTRCELGLGEVPVMRRTLPYGWLRALTRLVGGSNLLPLVRWLKRNDPIEEVFFSHMGAQMLRRNHLALFSEHLPEDVARQLGLARFFGQTDAMIEWAGRHAPRDATVWAFPHGGVTYVSAE